MITPTIVLASISPRRRQLLSLAGWPFVTLPADIDEQALPGEAPDAYVLRLAEEKARTVRAEASRAAPGALIVASDTTVVDGVSILGKPADSRDATAMLRRLRDRTHQVLTALAVLRPEDGDLRTDVCVTDVVMRDYSDEEIRAYVDTGDPLDKAGSYAIQHKAFHPVTQIKGCYPSVMGLPLCQLVRLLAQFGLSAQSDITQVCLTDLSAPCRVYQAVQSLPDAGG